MKHFNMGIVKGRVSKVTVEKSEGKGTPYLAITIEAPNDLYGNVLAYGRLWGKDKVDAFMAYHKANPGAAYRFKGFFSQYEKGENRYSNYTFFQWQAQAAGSEFKASFVLVGEFTALEKRENETVIHLHLIREGQGDYKDIEEDFEVYAFYPQHLDGIDDGDLIEVAGFLRAREPEDDFGRASGKILPYAMEIVKEAF